jgi:hypothetical protein
MAAIWHLVKTGSGRCCDAAAAVSAGSRHICALPKLQLRQLAVETRPHRGLIPALSASCPTSSVHALSIPAKLVSPLYGLLIVALRS